MLYPPLVNDILDTGCHVLTTSVRVQGVQLLRSLGFSLGKKLL
jgi:hypothetical protein